jgi:hypothetical protein
LFGVFWLPAATPHDALDHNRVTGCAAPGCVEADATQRRDDLVADSLEGVGIFLNAPVGHQQLPGFDDPLGTLQVIEDVALNGLLFFRFFDLIPDFGESAVVAATKILPRHNALTVEGRERLV